MPRHDDPAHWSGYIGGQQDFLAGRPALNHLDAQYLAGYEQELFDAQSAVQALRSERSFR
jgi:hypothetical protein